jgi:hypothetical protein
MIRLLVSLLILSINIFATGCMSISIEHEADEYTASADNIRALKTAGDFKVKVGAFSSETQDGWTRFSHSEEDLSGLKDYIKSPYENSFAKYLEEAVYKELFQADKIASNIDVELSGILIRNVVCTPVLYGNNSVVIEARFIVRQAGKIRYDKIKSVRHEWSPGGFVYLYPYSEWRAEKEYPLAVQTLLATLFADDAFISALK